MGFALAAITGLAALLLLWRLGVGRALWLHVGAALLLGTAGYVWQGKPTLPGHPVTPASEAIVVEPDLLALRERLLGRYTEDTAYLIAADAMTRAGDTGAAAQVILSGLRKTPKSFALWTGLGTALSNHDGGTVSPPALFAFQQAARLAPVHPAPPFFLGLAYIRSGQFAEARRLWARAVALSPVGTGYRDEIAIRLALLDQVLATPGALPAR